MIKSQIAYTLLWVKIVNCMMENWEYIRRHLTKAELPTRYNAVVAEMSEQGWELAHIKPTYGYVRTFWEQEGRGAFNGSYLVFRRKAAIHSPQRHKDTEIP